MGAAKKQEEQFIIRDEKNEYNVSRFLRFHPGGSNTISAYRGKNINKAMELTQHSPAAMHLLNQYAKGEQKDEKCEDIEDLVDWNKPMLWQVGKLGKRYQEWVSFPVDKPLRLFGSDVLESITVTPWYLIPTVWIPIIAFFLYCGFSENYQHISQDSTQVLWALLSFAFGIALWSLIEYSMHRWIFHYHPPENSSTLITLHFLFHGLHHKVPFDGLRLLFPPVPSIMIASILYTIYKVFLAQWILCYVFSGSLTGYVIYDLMHFYLHYGSPAADTYFYNMKRYHNHHHFTQDESGFGISNKFWDSVFKTEIFLKKLNVTLKW